MSSDGSAFITLNLPESFSVVARSVRDAEVGGSSPLAPTISNSFPTTHGLLSSNIYTSRLSHMVLFNMTKCSIRLTMVKTSIARGRSCRIRRLLYRCNANFLNAV